MGNNNNNNKTMDNKRREVMSKVEVGLVELLEDTSSNNLWEETKDRIPTDKEVLIKDKARASTHNSLVVVMVVNKRGFLSIRDTLQSFNIRNG